MAVNYTELFEDLGKVVSYWFSARDLWTIGEATYYQAVLDEFQQGLDIDAAVEGYMTEVFQSRSHYARRAAQIAKYALRRLQDRTTVLNEIGAINDSQAEVLLKLIRKMRTDSETINASVVTIGTVTAVGTATASNKGTILITKVLDGVTSPGTGMPPHLDYSGRNSELAKAETLTIECISDSYGQGAVTEGKESFRIQGRNPDPDGAHGVIGDEGSGQLGDVLAIHDKTANYLTNADFETFTTPNLPDGWVAVTGTVGTHILSEASTVYHGAKALELAGDGALAAIQLTHVMTLSRLVANAAYMVTARVKASADAMAGTFKILFTGTGYTAGATEQVNVAANTILHTAYELRNFLVVMPAQLPSDLKLSIQWSGTPGAGEQIHIDDLGMTQVTYMGGLGFVPVRGSNPFQKGDRYTSAISSTEGLFQQFFRRTFGVQLCSDNAAGETISDSLVS